MRTTTFVCWLLSQKKCYAIATFIMFFVCTFVVQAQVWKYAPLRNAAQQSAGLTGGEGGQWPQALAVSANGNLVMGGLDVAGVIRSENGGNIWKQAKAGDKPRGNCAIAIDPNNINRILAVGGNSGFNNSLTMGGQNIHGIYLSTNKGQSWERVLGIDNLAGWRDIREQLAWDPGSNDGTIEGGGSAIAYWSRAGYTYTQPSSTSTPVTPGIYKTTDGGLSWNLIPGSSARKESIVKVHPTNHTVYLANKDGFYRSTNGGTSFSRAFEGNITGMDVIPTSPNNVYICTSSGLYKSTNSGVTFTPISSASFPSNAFFIKVSPANSNRMMVQHEVGTYNTPWYYSHDGGVTWTITAQDNSLDYFYRHSGRKMYPVWHPTDPNIVWCVGGGWFTKSTDGGATLKWNNNGSSLICLTGYFAFSVNNPNVLAVTTQDYHASFTTNRGSTWKYLGKDILNTTNAGFAYGGYALNSNIVFVKKAEESRGATRIAITFDGGATLFEDKGPVGGEMTGYSSPTNNQVLFLGDRRSVDQGHTWTTLAGCTGVYTHNLNNPSEIFGVNNATTKSLVASTNHGATWTIIKSFGDTTIRDIAYDHNGDIFYIATEFKLIKYNRSTGQYVNLTSKVPKDQLGKSQQFRTVAVDPVNTDIVYVGNRRDAYASDVAICRSTDGGATDFIPLTKSPRHSNLNLYGNLDAGREVQCIRVHPVTREAWVGSACYGVWRIEAPYAGSFSTVQWESLTAKKVNNELVVDWITKEEKGNHTFEIEVSDNKSDFNRIGEISSSGSKSFQNNQYNFRQQTPVGSAATAMSMSLVFVIGLLFVRRSKLVVLATVLMMIGIISCRKFETEQPAKTAKYVRVAAVGLTGYKSYSPIVTIQQ